MRQKPPEEWPDRVEQYGELFAEYRRMRDSRGEEQLLVTMRQDAVTKDDTIRLEEFSTDMDALERFASYEVPKGGYAKSFDLTKADRVEHFKEWTASFHAGTTSEGHEVSVVHLSYAKEKGHGVWAVQPDMRIQLDAIKEFAARGIDYERELGHTKRWHPVVQVTAPGESEGTGVVRTLALVEDKGEAKERGQLRADKTAGMVLWPEPFRRPFETGDKFTVRRDTEGGYGYGKIGIGIEQQLWMRDRVGQSHVVGLWHEGSCEPHRGMAVRYTTPYEHNGRPREMLVFPDGARREPGHPEKVDYLLIEKRPSGSLRGTVKERFGDDVEKAVAKFHAVEHVHREQQHATAPELSEQELPRGFRR